MDQLSDEQIALAGRIFSVHRTSLRRRLERLEPHDPERKRVLRELEETQDLVDIFNDEDLDRLNSVA